MKRWGLNDKGCLCLISEDKTDKILIFDQVKPSVDPNTEFLPLVMTLPVEGKAIVFDEKTNQYGHG